VVQNLVYNKEWKLCGLLIENLGMQNNPGINALNMLQDTVRILSCNCYCKADLCNVRNDTVEDTGIGCYFPLIKLD